MPTDNLQSWWVIGYPIALTAACALAVNWLAERWKAIAAARQARDSGSGATALRQLDLDAEQRREIHGWWQEQVEANRLLWIEHQATLTAQHAAEAAVVRLTGELDTERHLRMRLEDELKRWADGTRNNEY